MIKIFTVDIKYDLFRVSSPDSRSSNLNQVKEI